MGFFRQIGQHQWYWWFMIFGALALEGGALYYQYALDEYPCALCIHVRIWVLAFVPIGVLGLVTRRSRGGVGIASALSLMAAVGLAERSWRTLAVERGWMDALGCSFDAGLPAWFALDRWFPAVFGVQGACGITPVVAFGVTMAEALIVISTLAVLMTALVTFATFLTRDPGGVGPKFGLR